jgi:hypothetical protein
MKPLFESNICAHKINGQGIKLLEIAKNFKRKVEVEATSIYPLRAAGGVV